MRRAWSNSKIQSSSSVQIARLGARPGRSVGGEERKLRRKQDFSGADLLDELIDFAGRRLGDAKLAGGDIDVGQSREIAAAGHGGEIVVLVRAQQVEVAGRARRDHARDVSLYELLGELGILQLIADGDAVAFRDELGDVVVGGVIRNAAHGNRNALLAAARSERDLQLA